MTDNSHLAAFFKPDPQAKGSKGLIFVGDRVVVYRRDNKTANHPLELDLPGGTSEKGETPFETFRREVREEIHLDVSPDSIICCVRCPDEPEPDTFFYFAVAKLPATVEAQIRLGDEGKDIRLMPPEDFAAAPDAWSTLRELTAEYLQFTAVTKS